MAGLKVDVTELRMHGHRLDAAATDLSNSHKRVHQDVADIAEGFSGGPAFAAINALVEDWEHETKAHHENLQSESYRHILGASKYENQDLQSAQDIKSANPQ
ncbi:WXG100 family type VII secretion target [Mycobacteroides abscessus subsp. abscessus]|uniref:WXG100 family type VII secretion target n=1 Tax=Mycobacteroides abscessus TaxID=36809 RepID=UPI00092C16CC|nr:WXG100 family type VII secretion target [Mycobacteroides abscessus]SIL71250.1 WXG100 family type VII secretion target [Mycobacteroides abscessus subsp. abscessus]